VELHELIRRATEIGKQTGLITFDQLNELCPKELEPEDIEALYAALRDEGIQVADESSQVSNPSCSFCGKAQREVVQLIAGAQGFICDECVQLYVQVISIEHPEWLTEHWKFVNDLAHKARDGEPPS
jgi:ClpX C4-type zinc finger/Sigma-70 factor, region 1.1